jgi:ketosteroid isomerase-like protein
MKSPLFAGLILLLALSARAADPAPTPSPAAIRELLADFLTNNSDPARHQNFWADDVVYTSAKGVVRGKPEIMKDVKEAGARPATNNPPPATGAQGAPVYTAEDINIRPYSGFAALNFRLVARNADGTTDTYRNSGTFVFRDGRWQVVTWQATKVPPAENK